MPKNRRPTRQGTEHPVGIGDILSQLQKKTPLGKQMQQAQIWEHWPTFAGAPHYYHGLPRKLKDKRLVVQVDSSVWMHKYTFCKWEIMTRINRHFGQEMVSDIYLTLDPDEDPITAQDEGAS